MYDRFYGFREEPFRLSPDHDFAFEHKAYKKARAYLAYAFLRAEGFVMVTGRPGTGKTTLIGSLLEQLAGETVTIANLVSTQLAADDLLRAVAYAFGIGGAGQPKSDVLHALSERLRNWHRENRRALLIVDEAQDLPESAIEELRLLTNIQLDCRPLLQVFLLGQPELRELIRRPQMEQVHQRVVAASHLHSLERDETESYIRYRLQRVGWSGDPRISVPVFDLLHQASEGIPRRINLICGRLLLHCAVEGSHDVRVADMREVLEEMRAENLAVGAAVNPRAFSVPDRYEAPPPPARGGRDATGTQAAVSEVRASGSPEPASTERAPRAQVSTLTALRTSQTDREGPSSSSGSESGPRTPGPPYLRRRSTDGGATAIGTRAGQTVAPLVVEEYSDEQALAGASALVLESPRQRSADPIPLMALRKPENGTKNDKSRAVAEESREPTILTPATVHTESVPERAGRSGRERDHSWLVFGVGAVISVAFVIWAATGHRVPALPW